MDDSAEQSGTHTLAAMLACASNERDTGALDAITGSYAAAFTSFFCERHGDVLLASAPGAHALLERWSAGEEPTMATAWHESIGRVCDAARSSNGADAVGAAVAASAHLGASGLAGEWSAELPMVRLRWGQLVLPAATRVEVSGSGDEAEVIVHGANGAQTITLRRGSEGWLSEDCDELPRFGLSGISPLIGPSEARHADTTSEAPEPAHLRDVATACADAAQALERHAPAFAAWSAGVVRLVAPLDGSDGLLRSWSSFEAPGTVGLSTPAPVCALAEMLVHEASHQYLYLAQRLDALDDGTDATEYYSPLKGTSRPIGAILTAYHAVVNMVLLYRAWLTSGGPDRAYCERNLERHEAEIPVMQGHLAASPALTPFGRELVDELNAAVA